MRRPNSTRPTFKNSFDGKSRWSQALPAVVYAVLVGGYFYPYFKNFSTALIGPPEDNMQDIWNLWYQYFYIRGGATSFFDTTKLYFPEGTNLLYHSFSYVNIFLLALAKNTVNSLEGKVTIEFLQNGALVLSFWIASMGAYLLVHHFTKNRLASILGGFVFGFSPFHFAHSLHHFHIAMLQYIPFFVYFFIIHSQTKKISAFSVAILMFVASALSSWYYLVYILMFIAWYIIWRYICKKLSTYEFWASAGIIFCTFVLLSPIILPMIISGAGNPRSYSAGHDVYVADLAAFVVFHPYHILSEGTTFLTERMTGNDWEKTVYLGLANMALVGWLCFQRKFRETEAFSLATSGMLFFTLFAVGSWVHVLGISLPVPMPTLLTQELPILGNLRTPSRAIVFVYLFLSILVGLAVKALMERGARPEVIILIFLLMVADFYPTRREATPVRTLEAHKIIQADRQKDFGVLDLPKTYIGGNTYMMYQTRHGRPIVNASVSRKLNETLADRLEMSNLAVQKEQLVKNKVKYILIHKTIDGARKVRWERYRQNYAVLLEDADAILMRVYD